MTKNWRKKVQPKMFQNRFSIINCNLLIFKLLEKPSALKREHPSLQKRGNLLTFFYVLWVIFCHPGSVSGLRFRILIRIQGSHWIPIQIWIQIRIHISASCRWKNTCAEDWWRLSRRCVILSLMSLSSATTRPGTWLCTQIFKYFIQKISAVDPGPVGSASFWRIRIRIHFNLMDS